MATNKVDMAETTMSAQQFAGYLEGLAKRVKEGSFGQRHVDVNDQVERWRNQYKVLYKINPDFSNLYIPDHVGFDRLIIVPKGLTHQKWVMTARTIHEVYLFNDDIDSVTTNDRTPKDRSYGVWIRDRQEADEELADKSANVLAREKINSIVLLERLVAGTDYLFEHMCHMDVEHITLCAGSRFSGGDVPLVRWSSGNRRVCVGYCSPSGSAPSLRARAVVS